MEKENRVLDNLREEHKFGSIQIVREDLEKKEHDLVKKGFGKVQEDEAREIEIVQKEDEDEYYFEYSYDNIEEQEELEEAEKL